MKTWSTTTMVPGQSTSTVRPRADRGGQDLDAIDIVGGTPVLLDDGECPPDPGVLHRYA